MDQMVEEMAFYPEETFAKACEQQSVTESHHFKVFGMLEFRASLCTGTSITTGQERGACTMMLQ